MDIRRNNELIGFAVGKLFECLKALKSDDLFGGSGIVDELDTVGNSLLDLQNGGSFTFGFADFGFSDSLGL